MFNNSSNAITLPMPHLGINSNSSDNPQYAKYLENVFISDNNTCDVRYGTVSTGVFNFNADRMFRSQIAIMSYLKSTGDSDIIVYQNYLTNLPHIEILNTENVTVEGLGNTGYSKLKINISTLSEVEKTFLKKRIVNGSYIYIRQDSLSDGENILDVVYSDTEISFNIRFPIEFFDVQIEPLAPIVYFDILWERGGLYKLVNNVFEDNPLYEDLEPNVIVSHINYQGYLLIANGVDRVLEYDGVNVQQSKSKTTIFPTKGFNVGETTITFDIIKDLYETYYEYLKVNSNLKILDDGGNVPLTIHAITFTELENNAGYTVVLTFDSAEDLATLLNNKKMRNLSFDKPIPAFSFLAVVNNRLWATGADNNSKDSFRGGGAAMRVYYASKQKDIHAWYSVENGDIAFIDLSSNISIPDNIETILEFEGKSIFIGRETMHIYSGYDPTVNKLVKNDLYLPDFKLEKVIKIGILQKSLFVEIPNDILFMSKYGIVSISSVNEFQQLAVSYNFSSPIANYVIKQIEMIVTDYDYRNMRMFLYPHGRFIGFKLKYNTIIYQLRQKGCWTIFTGDFNSATSFAYNTVDQNLYLGTENGELLLYADKMPLQKHTDNGEKPINWKIHYNWINTKTTWNNEKVTVVCRSLDDTEIKISVYFNYDDSHNYNIKLNIKQCASLYDYSNFEEGCYSRLDTALPNEDLRFTADSIMLLLEGSVENKLTLNNAFLHGGTNDDSQ